jgi:glycerol-3-phosphate cytidylyltransferase-like family protein
MATFAQYYHRIHKYDSQKAGVDPEANKCNVPLLSKDKVNRVMIYGGAFNPPHVGHLGVLCHAFQSSSDLNIVAGMVYSLEVDQLAGKNCRSNRRLVLSKRQRSELWERDVRFPAWAFAPQWAYHMSDDFETDIASAAKEDGYEILYIRVMGPDTWDINYQPRHTYPGYSEFLVTDATRRASFFSPDDVPQPIKGCTSWQRVQLLQQTKPVVEVLESSPLVATAIASLSIDEVESSNSSSSEVSEDSVSHYGSSKSSTVVTGANTPSSSAEGQSYFSVVYRRVCGR